MRLILNIILTISDEIAIDKSLYINGWNELLLDVLHQAVKLVFVCLYVVCCMFVPHIARFFKIESV